MAYGNSDTGQVSTTKSSIPFKYFYLLKISMEILSFGHKGEVHEKSLNIFSFSEKHTQKCVVSQKDTSKKILYFSKMLMLQGTASFLAIEIST